jgi:hypothetical protein
VNIRLYLDEDSMQQALVNALRARGVEVITALETGMIERKDEHHLEYATERGCVLFSFNVGDYFYLHTNFLSEGKQHAGIILAQQQRYSVGEIMRKLLLLISTTPAEAMVNQVEFLSSWD